MPTYTKQTPKGSSFEDIPEDMYVATIKEIRDVESKYDTERLMIVYQLESDEESLDGRTIAEFVNITFGHTQAGTPSKWLQRQAVFCAAQRLPLPEDGEEFDTEDYVGARVRIVVSHTPKKDGDGYWVNVATVQGLREKKVTTEATKPSEQYSKQPKGKVDEQAEF